MTILLSPLPAFAPIQSEQPFVAITSSGWNATPGLDLNRVREFSTGVMVVRIAMTAVPGLHSEQSFFLPGGLDLDPMTISFWRDEISMQAFAHGPGVHRLQMLRDREQKLADRVSFTRCSGMRTVGTWYGVDPLHSCGTPRS
jgi:hypothetical protein